ncbi:helix-turn-helix domain-containing protein [Sediminitomix flava]|uniref:Excisionase family DNA binding protein n=1 Tax=Sediminitomix flava TaxID=379075 RepID=A0A315ZAI0_SEDFL|nr:helix-turn-helix domain-containing protein [Sediminitomix flava]PWJ41090.1 excisionase family DNA binding protein [Sediminitomix flava]
MDVNTNQMQNPFEALHAEIRGLRGVISELKEEVRNVQKQKPVSPSERLSRKEVAKEYSLSLGTLHTLMKKGEIPFEKVGRKTVFKRADVEKFFESKKKNLKQ